MHDIKWIRKNKEIFTTLLEKRGVSSSIIQKILDLDEGKKQIQTLIQRLQQARNEKAKLISTLANNSSSEVKTIKKDASDIKDKLAELEKKLDANDELEEILLSIPNLPLEDVPFGKDENDAVEIRKIGNPRKFNFKPKHHFELGEELGLMDFVDTAKISGSRFVTLKGTLSKLERALAAFMLDVHTKQFNFEEMSVPLLVRDSAMYNAGQLPKFEDESYKTETGHRLIPTAEVPLVNYVAGKTIDVKDLPIRYTAYSNCFRSEAGAAGRDTRGMIRQHQFSKVELVSICSSEQAEKEHEYIINAAEEILKQLNLPYRVMLLCSQDMGFTAAKTYDLEVWLPAQDKYREISSCSNCTDFQARRMKAKYRENNNLLYLNTLNGSGLAVGRTLVAILENYQQEDGSITIPEILIPYMGGITKITKK
jgi:seryl-tRNA synthetase